MHRHGVLHRGSLEWSITLISTAPINMTTANYSTNSLLSAAYLVISWVPRLSVDLVVGPNEKKEKEKKKQQQDIVFLMFLVPFYWIRRAGPPGNLQLGSVLIH